MTKIVYEQRANTRILTLDGHSGYSTAGSDIVCASVSALTDALAMSCMEYEPYTTTIVARDGYFHIECYTIHCEIEISTIFKMTLKYLKELANTMPEYVSFDAL